MQNSLSSMYKLLYWFEEALQHYDLVIINKCSLIAPRRCYVVIIIIIIILIILLLITRKFAYAHYMNIILFRAHPVQATSRSFLVYELYVLIVINCYYTSIFCITQRLQRCLLGFWSCGGNHLITSESGIIVSLKTIKKYCLMLLILLYKNDQKTTS